MPYASEIPGAMHACGHDLHTAMLVGAARLLSAHRDELAGDVVFMFQPGEEGWDGAGAMLREGVLDAAGRPVQSAYGIHVMSGLLPRGRFATRPGNPDGRVRPAARHGPRARRPRLDAAPGARPDQRRGTTRRRSADARHAPLRRLRPGRPDRRHASTAARSATSSRTRRSSTPRSGPSRPRRASGCASSRVRLCEHVAHGYGLEVDAVWEEEYPLTINDATHAAFAAEVVTDVFGAERYQPQEQSPYRSGGFLARARGGAGLLPLPRRLRARRPQARGQQPQPARRVQRRRARLAVRCCTPRSRSARCVATPRRRRQVGTGPGGFAFDAYGQELARSAVVGG